MPRGSGFGKAIVGMHRLLKGYRYDFFETKSKVTKGITLPHHRGRIAILSTPETYSYIREMTRGIGVILSTPPERLKTWLKSRATMEIFMMYAKGKKRIGKKRKKVEIRNIQDMIPLLEEYKSLLTDYRDFLDRSIREACKKGGKAVADFWIDSILSKTAEYPIPEKSGATFILHPETTTIPLFNTGKYLSEINDVLYLDKKDSFVAWIGFRENKPLSNADPELGDAVDTFDLFAMHEFGRAIEVNDEIRKLFARHGIILQKDIIFIPARPYFRYVVKNVPKILKEALKSEGVEIDVAEGEI